MSFRLVYDRETGKPKGYGFCEYRDQETALSAMRNLNGCELNGRTLRVDNAANEKTREEFRNLQTTEKGSFESPYGPDVDPEKAPEAISKAVASLPPDQMFELAKQMKQCIQSSPTEARNMLVQNPQLAYALLQALVVMRVVDPQVAVSILYRPNTIPAPLVPPEVPQSSHHGQWPPDFTRHQQPMQQQMQQQVPFPPAGNMDPRMARQQGNIDPRQARDPRQAQAAMRQAPQQQPPPMGGLHMGPGGVDPRIKEEQEKAALIMQVLQLTDQQIAVLPPEQRHTILQLKAQMSQQ
jgi:cleavage stimulation factor subunit 2